MTQVVLHANRLIGTDQISNNRIFTCPSARATGAETAFLAAIDA